MVTMSTAEATHTNADIGIRLGLAHSTISRMRRGERLGSLATFTKIAQITGKPLEAVVAAAALTKTGDLDPWLALLDEVGAAE